MIYGHELERGWSTGGLLCGMAVGLVLGAGLGILLAPARSPQLDRVRPATDEPRPRAEEDERRTC